MKRYVVGLSGTHGTGKSTISKGVKESGIAVSEAQLSRTAQKLLGWDSLKRAQESVENMWALQDAVLTAMNERDEAIENSRIVTLVERTPADLWAYTKMWCGRLGIDYTTNAKAQTYYAQCRDLINRYAMFLVVPMTAEIPFVEEPNRADLASRQPVADSIEEFLSAVAPPVHVINEITPTKRALEAVILIGRVK